MSVQGKTSVEHVELEAIKALGPEECHDEHKLTFAQLLRRHPKIIGWSVFWCTCALGWGFDTQVNGAMVSVPAFREYYGYVYQGNPVIPANWLSAFNVISSVGQFFGGFLCSYVADRIGRKKSLAVGVVITTGGIFGETFSSSAGAFIASKLILGFGVGFYLTLGPITCSEISPVVLRGLSSAGVNLAIAVGQLASNAATKGFGNRNDVWAFRGPFLVQILFSVILITGGIFSPESPYYLVRQGRIDEAKHSLKALFGTETDATSALTTIQSTVNAEREASSPSYISAFRGTDRIRTLISIGAFTCQHLAGIVFVLSFSTYFFQLAGVSTSSAFDLGVGVTACGVAGNFCSWFLVNRVGRRPIFLGGMICCTTLLLLIGILDVIPTGAAKWAQASLTVVYSFVYFLTIGAVAFVLLGEVSSLQLRAKTTALATATQAVWSIVMNFVVPYMVNPDSGNLKGKVGFIFGGMSLVTTLVCFFYIPELKGKTYEEIDVLFRRRVPPRKMGTYELDHA